MLRENFLQAILEIILIPLVISKNPLKRGDMKLVSISKKLNKGEKVIVTRFSNPLAFTIEMILEKITTNPPIKTIVEILLVILSANTSPKLEKETKVFLFESILFVERIRHNHQGVLSISETAQGNLLAKILAKL